MVTKIRCEPRGSKPAWPSFPADPDALERYVYMAASDSEEARSDDLFIGERTVQCAWCGQVSGLKKTLAQHPEASRAPGLAAVAALQGHVGALEMLLDAGADIESRLEPGGLAHSWLTARGEGAALSLEEVVGQWHATALEIACARADAPAVRLLDAEYRSSYSEPAIERMPSLSSQPSYSQ